MGWFFQRRTSSGRSSVPSDADTISRFGRLGFPTASVSALWIACLADSLLIRGPLNATYLFYLSCLSLGIGLFQGFGFELLFATIGKLPRVLRAPVWLAIELALGGWLAYSLGAFVRIGSRYNHLALVVLGACLSGAVGMAVVATGFQPTRRSPFGPFRRLSVINRSVIAAILLVNAIGLTVVDREYFTNYYSEAHLALRACAVWSLMFALLAAAGPRELLGWNRRRLAAAWVCFLAPVLLMRESDADTFYAFGVRVYPSLVLSLSRLPFDVDLDGYASVLGDGDCAPFNRAIHPGAREIPGNGVDDNCIAGDGVASQPWSNPDQVPIPPEPSPLSVVLITVDALRPDHLGLYNPDYGPLGRATTPELDRWSKDAVIFRHAYSSGAWTGISVASLMRGLYPRRLRWTTYYEGNRAPLKLFRAPLEGKLRPNEKIASAFLFASGDRHYPLAWWLRRRGVWTAAVVDDGFTEVLSPSVGTDKGFSSYRNTKAARDLPDSDYGTAQLAIRTLNTMRTSQPFFLWVHFFGTHGPSRKHPGIRDYGNTVADQYDHEIRFMDKNLAGLLQAIDAHPSRENTAVFIAADHGEAILSKGRRHGFDLSEEDIRIPLLAKVPGWKPRYSDQLVSLVDVMPTILALTQTPAPVPLDGIDLGPLVAKPELEHERVLCSDTWRLRRNGELIVDIAAAYNGRYKLAFSRLSGTSFLYDQRGLTERRSLVHARSRSKLSQALWTYLEATGGPPTVEK